MLNDSTLAFHLVSHIGDLLLNRSTNGYEYRSDGFTSQSMDFCPQCLD